MISTYSRLNCVCEQLVIKQTWHGLVEMKVDYKARDQVSR